MGKGQRPTLGTALGMVAVLIATSGAAFAAGVTITSSKQIKNGIVTGADLKNHTVKPIDLSAAPWRVVGTPGQPHFLADWSNAYTEFYGKVSFRKGADGRVYFRGTAGRAADSVDGTDIFTLPSGYRPKICQIFAVPSSEIGDNQVLGSLEVCPDGDVYLYPAADDRFVNLDGVAFAVN